MLGILCILAHLHCILHYRRSFIQMLWSSQSNLIRWKMLLAARLSPLLWWGCQVLRLYYVLYHFSILFATRSFTVIRNVSATAYLLSTCVPYLNCVLWHGGLYSNRVLETPPCVLSGSLFDLIRWADVRIDAFDVRAALVVFGTLEDQPIYDGYLLSDPCDLIW